MSPLLWLSLVAAALLGGMAGCVVGLALHVTRDDRKGRS